MSCVVLVLTPDLGSFLLSLYRLTEVGSAFALDASLPGPDRSVLVQTSGLTARHNFEAMYAGSKGRERKKLGAPLEF